MKSSLHAGDDGKVVLGDFIAWGAAVAKGNSIEFNDARKSEWTMAFNTFFANGAAGESVDAFVENCQTFLKYAGAGTIAEAAKVNIVREVYMYMHMQLLVVSPSSLLEFAWFHGCFANTLF